MVYAFVLPDRQCSFYPEIDRGQLIFLTAELHSGTLGKQGSSNMMAKIVALVSFAVVISFSNVSHCADRPAQVSQLRHAVPLFVDDPPVPVSLKHAMFGAATAEDPKSRQLKLVGAVVFVDGERIELDWSQSKEAERELIKHSVPSHGDGRVAVANLQGRFVQRIRKSKGKDGSTVRAQYLVLVVEKLAVELVSPAAQRPNRPSFLDE